MLPENVFSARRERKGPDLHPVPPEYEARRAEAPSGACREGGAMRRPGGTGRNEVKTAFPLTRGMSRSDRGLADWLRMKKVAEYQRLSSFVDQTLRISNLSFAGGLDSVLVARGQTQSKDGDEIKDPFHDTCFKGLPRDGIILVQTRRQDASFSRHLDDQGNRGFVGVLVRLFHIILKYHPASQCTSRCNYRRKNHDHHH